MLNFHKFFKNYSYAANLKNFIKYDIPKNIPDNLISQERGIVICAGGIYAPSAYIAVRKIRHHGSKLPIYIYHKKGEWHNYSKIKQEISKFDVTFVPIESIDFLFPQRQWGGFELKILAILYSPFKEVLLLDADNFPIINVDTMFDWPQFKEYKYILWKDIFIGPNPDVFNPLGLPVPNELDNETESGQVLVDKVERWKSLWVTWWINNNSDFFYKIIYGDKDTFPLGAQIAKEKYIRPDKIYRSLYESRGEISSMIQHNFEGEEIFYHRHLPKLKLENNESIEGFYEEDMIFEWVEELNKKISKSLEKKYFSEVHGKYDSRFFIQPLTSDESIQILYSLLDDFINYSKKRNIKLILNHGNLLSWHWNKEIIFPWDDDIDISILEEDFKKLNSQYITSTSLLDINPNWENRETLNYYKDNQRIDGLEPNKIDARLIDTNTGLYIDITCLSFTDGKFFTKCPFYYDKQDVLPLKKIKYKDKFLYIFNNYKKTLVSEYGEQALTNKTYKNYYFDEELKKWIKFSGSLI